MDDSAIIDMYFARNEEAISETDRKYGGIYRKLAINILGVFQDAEECVSDGYHKTWTVIPPQRPLNLRAFVARIVRNLSISRVRAKTAQKRSSGETELLLSELAGCVPDREGDPCTELELRELTASIDRWLQTLCENDRYIFLQRYWYGMAVKEIKDPRAGSVSKRLFRLRNSLHKQLESEGLTHE